MNQLDAEARYRVTTTGQPLAPTSNLPAIPLHVCVKTVGILLIVLIPLVVCERYYREDESSLRYILWKHDLYPYEVGLFTSAIKSDPQRDDLVRGLSKSELERRFPNAHTVPNAYQRYYDRMLRERGIDHLWIGDSCLAILLDDGRGVEITLMKG